MHTHPTRNSFRLAAIGRRRPPGDGLNLGALGLFWFEQPVHTVNDDAACGACVPNGLDFAYAKWL